MKYVAHIQKKKRQAKHLLAVDQKIKESVAHIYQKKVEEHITKTSLRALSTLQPDWLKAIKSPIMTNSLGTLKTVPATVVRTSYQHKENGRELPEMSSQMAKNIPCFDRKCNVIVYFVISYFLIFVEMTTLVAP